LRVRDNAIADTLLPGGRRWKHRDWLRSRAECPLHSPAWSSSGLGRATRKQTSRKAGRFLREIVSSRWAASAAIDA